MDETIVKKHHGTFAVYFTCRTCRYWSKTGSWSACNHPAVAELDFEGRELAEYTEQDYEKLDKLVNEILHLSVNKIDEGVPNFEFPFKYEPIWVIGCHGYIKRIGAPINYGK